jgi:hypothetical protein
MPIHQLNLNDDATETNAVTPNQPLVDDPMLSSHNQPAVGGLHQFAAPAKTMQKKTSLNTIIATVVITVLLGVGTGYLLNAKVPASSLPGGSATPVSQVATRTVKTGDVFGSSDASAFKDSANGYLEIGGLDGEGSHSLHRPGGVSQTVYLTSSVTDLSKFEGMEVKIWGETFRGQKAGWLMDVGRIEVLNPEGQKPE